MPREQDLQEEKPLGTTGVGSQQHLPTCCSPSPLQPQPPSPHHPLFFCTPLGLGSPSFLLSECNKPLPPLPCTRGQVCVLFFLLRDATREILENLNKT